MDLLLIAGLAAFSYVIGHVTRRLLSEVIVFIAIGIIVGPQVLGLIDTDGVEALSPVLALALGAIVFLIGERLDIAQLGRLRHTLTPIAVFENLATFGAVFGVMLLVGLSVSTAFLLGAIALSTSPTTLLAVVASRRAAGRVTDHMLAATALNNVTSAVLFGLGLPLVLATEGTTGGAIEGLQTFAQLVLASTVIGLAGGVVLRRWYASTTSVGDRLLFVIVVLLTVVAASRAIDTPVVLSTLVMGAWTANDRRDMQPLFQSLRILEAPIYLVFFVVAGVGIHLDQLIDVGGLGLAFFAARFVGKIAGAWIGVDATRSGRRAGWSYHIGEGLLPFAGMAIGLAAFTFEKATAVGADTLGLEVDAIILGTVVIFELLGPFTVGRALDATGESGATARDEEAVAQAEERAAPHKVRHILFPISNPEMARSKAAPVVDLAVSAGAALTALHVVPPGFHDPDAVDPTLSIVRQIASARGLTAEIMVRESESVLDAILTVAREAAVDLIVMGEPAPRMLDRGGRLVNDVAARAGVPVMAIPTPADELRPVRDQVPSRRRSRRSPAEPGVSEPEPGASEPPEPGAGQPEPGASESEPGASESEPGASERERVGGETS